MDSIRGALFSCGENGLLSFFFGLYPGYLFLSIVSQHENFCTIARRMIQ